jgi:glycosyltransferase involved in cell wall biosynthesis
MHICSFSLVNYWQGVKGGMEVHGKLLSQGLVNKGHNVSIISTQHPEGKEIEEQKGVKIFYLQNTLFGSRRNQWPSESVRKFQELHQQDPFDVIWSQSFAAYGLAHAKSQAINIPVIPILQGCIHQEIITFKSNLFHKYRNPHTILKTLMGLFFSYYREQKPLLARSSRIITVSHELIHDLKRWYGPHIANKALSIYNGIDTHLFSPNNQHRKNIRAKFGVRDSEILLLTCGTLNKEKGHHLAIESLHYLKEQIPNIKLMIIGSGESKSNLEKRTGDAGFDKNVIFVGFVNNDDLPKYYNSADIYIMPTLRVEGLPFVLLEAMSCGKPVVASRIGGNISVVKDGSNGLLIEPGDILQLAEKVKLIINNPELHKRLSSSARGTIVDNFTSDHMIKKTIDSMRAIVE